MCSFRVPTERRDYSFYERIVVYRQPSHLITVCLLRGASQSCTRSKLMTINISMLNVLRSFAKSPWHTVSAATAATNA